MQASQAKLSNGEPHRGVRGYSRHSTQGVRGLCDADKEKTHESVMRVVPNVEPCSPTLPHHPRDATGSLGKVWPLQKGRAQNLGIPPLTREGKRKQSKKQTSAQSQQQERQMSGVQRVWTQKRSTVPRRVRKPKYRAVSFAE